MVPDEAGGFGDAAVAWERLPSGLWAGAALLGWVAGEMIVWDPWLTGRLVEDLAHRAEIPAAVVAAAAVLALDYVLRQRSATHEVRGEDFQ